MNLRRNVRASLQTSVIVRGPTDSASLSSCGAVRSTSAGRVSESSSRRTVSDRVRLSRCIRRVASIRGRGAVEAHVTRFGRSHRCPAHRFPCNCQLPRGSLPYAGARVYLAVDRCAHPQLCQASQSMHGFAGADADRRGEQPREVRVISESEKAFLHVQHERMGCDGYTKLTKIGFLR